MLNTCRVLWIEILNILLCGLPVGLAIAYWSEVKLNRFTKMSYSTSKHSLWSRLEHLNISVIWSERVFFYSLNTVDSLSGICWVIVVGGSLCRALCTWQLAAPSTQWIAVPDDWSVQCTPIPLLKSGARISFIGGQSPGQESLRIWPALAIVWGQNLTPQSPAVSQDKQNFQCWCKEIIRDWLSSGWLACR